MCKWDLNHIHLAYMGEVEKYTYLHGVNLTFCPVPVEVPIAALMIIKVDLFVHA